MKRIKIKMTIYLMLAGFLFSIGQLFAQPYSSIKDVDILEQQREVLKQKYKNNFNELEILGGNRIDEIHTIVAYKKNGIYHEAVLNSGRKEMMLIAVAAEIPVDDIPHIVMSALKDSKYQDKEVVKSFLVDTPYGENYFALDVSKNDTTKRLFFNELGVIQKPPY